VPAVHLRAAGRHELPPEGACSDHRNKNNKNNIRYLCFGQSQPWANPTTSEFTTTYNARVVEGFL
jgi:hypothetical protein